MAESISSAPKGKRKFLLFGPRQTAVVNKTGDDSETDSSLDEKGEEKPKEEPKIPPVSFFALFRCVSSLKPAS
jgi:hypothetical protein